MSRRPEISKEKLAEYCLKHHIRKLAFFSMEAELSQILGHKVDLHTPQFLSRFFRDRVMAEAEVQYVAA